MKGPVPEESYFIPLGKADVKREGKDITVVTTAEMLIKTLSAAEELEKEEINVEVVEPRSAS